MKKAKAQMKKEYVQQFETMRGAIQSNVDTIKSLLEQSQKLSDIICNLPGGADNGEIKQQLEKSKADLDEKLEALIKSTNTLYESYMSLVKKMFG